MSRYGIIEVLVGLLVSVTVIAIGGFVVSRLSHKLKSYNRCHTVKAIFADVDGLRVGSEVRISGVRVGSVVSVYLDQDSAPVTEMCIQEGLDIPVDSSVSITYADLLGKKYVDIIPGSDDNLIGEGGYFVHTSTAPSLSMILAKVVNSSLK